jgi:hypothetical protein
LPNAWFTKATDGVQNSFVVIAWSRPSLPEQKLTITSYHRHLGLGAAWVDADQRRHETGFTKANRHCLIHDRNTQGIGFI